jgi:hypothetical protein
MAQGLEMPNGEWTPYRHPTLDSGEPYSHFASLREAETERERLRALADSEEVVAGEQARVWDFDDLFDVPIDHLPSHYDTNPVGMRGALDELVASVGTGVQFTDELNCFAEHAAFYASIGIPTFFSLPRYRAAARCGLVMNAFTKSATRFVSADQLRGCGWTEGSGMDEAVVCATSIYSADTISLGDVLQPWMGTGAVLSTSGLFLGIAGVDELPHLGPVPRVVESRTERLGLRAASSDGDIGELLQVDEFGDAPLCEDAGAEPERFWRCDLPPESDFHGFSFSWRTDRAFMSPAGFIVHRETEPELPQEIPGCIEPDTVLDVTGEMVRSWVNEQRRALGRPALLSLMEMNEFVDLLRRFIPNAPDRNRWAGAGLGFPGLIAQSYVFSPRLYSDEPCREWHSLLRYSPALMTALLSPHSTHLAISAGPGANLNTSDIYLQVIEEDSPERLQQMQRRMDELLVSNFRRMLRSWPELLPQVEIVVAALHRLVASGDFDAFDAGRALNSDLDAIYDAGGVSVWLWYQMSSERERLSIPRAFAVADVGVTFTIVRRAAHRVNRVAYSVVLAFFHNQ